MNTEPYNLLPLDTWRRILGFNPWHFWGLQSVNENLARLDSECLDITTEYAWQNTQDCGREEIRAAIIKAEQDIRDWAGFWPAPKYGETTVPYPKLADQRVSRYSPIQNDWRRLSVGINELHLQALGIEARTLIGTADTTGMTPTLVYSDEDNDGLDDTFTITLPYTGTDPEEVAVYFTAADRVDGADLTERWRVQPVRVKITGGNVIITGRRWLVVLPELYEGITDAGLSADDPANFVDELDVYRRYTDRAGQTVDDSQAVLIWETRPCHGWWCICGCTAALGSTDPANVARAIARAGIRDAETGFITPAASTFNSTTGLWMQTSATCWEPDRVQARFLAGIPLMTQNQMNSGWAAIVARLAAAELVRPICACDAANKELYRWQFDMTSSGGDEQYQVGFDDLQNPLGTRRGHIDAWKWISRHEVTLGFSPG